MRGHDRRQDLLQTLVVLGIALTPGWLLPGTAGRVYLGVVALLGLPAVITTWTHAPWVPTPPGDLPRVLEALQLGPGAHCVDLGCGDGRMVMAIAQATGARCTGIELAPGLLLWAKARIAWARIPGTAVRWGDVYRSDLQTYDALYVWGTSYSVGTAAFAEMLAARARPGARLVAYATPVEGLVPIAVDDGGQRPVYTYVLPEVPT